MEQEAFPLILHCYYCNGSIPGGTAIFLCECRIRSTTSPFGKAFFMKVKMENTLRAMRVGI
jgi:hypothetical protein